MPFPTLLLAVAGLLVAGLAWAVWRHAQLRRGIERTLAALAAGDEEVPPLPGESGRILRKVVQRRETLLREASDARFDLREILAGLEDGVLVSDHRHLITLVNPPLLEIFGLKTQPIGQSVLTTLRQPILQTMLEGILQDGVPQQAELALTGRGDPVQLIISAAPLRDPAGLPGALVVVRDESRLRRLEEMRREFVGNVSHELRTPLSIFHGYLENLIDSPDATPEELGSSLLVMRKHSLRMNALVEDLLTLARLESGRDQLHPEPIEVAAFLRETLQDWAPKAAAKGLELKLEVPDDLPELMVDSLKFHQVLTNLLDNGVKHSAHGSIVVRAQVRESCVEVEVEDTGAGIPRDDLPHIFERFYRADKARSRELGGTGLGLAIVKHIAQAHGGNVKAESELGKGTRVTLRLPIEG